MHESPPFFSAAVVRESVKWRGDQIDFALPSFLRINEYVWKKSVSKNIFEENNTFFKAQNIVFFQMVSCVKIYFFACIDCFNAAKFRFNGFFALFLKFDF